MAEEFIDPDSYFSLSPVEMGNERNAITAAVASGGNKNFALFSAAKTLPVPFNLSA